MQSIFITGRLGKDAELRSTQNGDQVCSFNLAVDQGWGDRKTTNWFRVSYWGKRGAGIQPYLLKGTQLAVQGDLEIGEWEGKPQFDVRANNVDLMGGRTEPKQREETFEGGVRQGGVTNADGCGITGKILIGKAHAPDITCRNDDSCTFGL